MDITVIIPIHKLSGDETAFVKKALDSVPSEAKDIILVAQAGVKALLDDSNITGFTKFCEIGEDEKTCFPHMVNRCVEMCNTEYFSILEFDDTYTDTFFKNAQKYFDSGFDASMYLPLTEIVEGECDNAIGYINESVWSISFVKDNDLGFLDLDSTLMLPIFNVTGGVIKKKDFVECGKLKESMKLHFNQEFLCRFLNLGKKCFVVPKVGYRHLINREGAFYTTINDTMSVDEANFWLELTAQEYFFKNDRNKTYEE